MAIQTFELVDPSQQQAGQRTNMEEMMEIQRNTLSIAESTQNEGGERQVTKDAGRKRVLRRRDEAERDWRHGRRRECPEARRGRPKQRQRRIRRAISTI